jgi:hypothetical protein
MKKVLILWVLAFPITIATAVYQRVTSSAHPIYGIIKIEVKVINNVSKYQLLTKLWV